MQIDGPPNLMYNIGPIIRSIHDLKVKIVWVHGPCFYTSYLILQVGPGLYISYFDPLFYTSYLLHYQMWVQACTLAILIHASTPVTYCIPNIIGGSMFVHQLGTVPSEPAHNNIEYFFNSFLCQPKELGKISLVSLYHNGTVVQYS